MDCNLILVSKLELMAFLISASFVATKREILNR